MRLHRKARSLTAALITFGSLVGGANAAVLFSQSGNDLHIELTESIDFVSTVTYSGTSYFGISFENVFSVDQGAVGTVATTPTISVPIDSVTNSASNVFAGLSSGDLTAQNLHMNFNNYSSSVTITPGEVVTIPTGIFIATNYFSEMNALLPDLDPSSAFLWTFSGTRASDSVDIRAVPEPSSVALLGLYCLSLVFRRSRC